MIHGNLPPLDCLVYFEAVARHSSFSKAAVELSVTQAAVSKRIANLENRLGVLLFDRSTRRPQLTADGMYMFDKSRMALNFLTSAFEHLGDKSETSINIAADNALAYFWLLQRLKRYSLSEDSREVTLTTVEAEEKIESGSADIAIRNCDGQVSGWQSHLLFEEILAPVASPKVAENFELCNKYEFYDPELSPKLLLCPQRAPTCVTWEIWAEQVQFDGFGSLQSVTCGNYVNSIGAAIEGKGIALCNLRLNAQEIETGQLQQIGDCELRTGRGCYLLCPENGARETDVEKLLRFLIASVQSEAKDDDILLAS